MPSSTTPEGIILHRPGNISISLCTFDTGPMFLFPSQDDQSSISSSDTSLYRKLPLLPKLEDTENSDRVDTSSGFSLFPLFSPGSEHVHSSSHAKFSISDPLSPKKDRNVIYADAEEERTKYCANHYVNYKRSFRDICFPDPDEIDDLNPSGTSLSDRIPMRKTQRRLTFP